MKTAVVWFRRDLRLHHNPALTAAARAADRVVPVFVWAPHEEAPWAPGAASRWWLHHSLAALGRSLDRLGAPLVIRAGESATVLSQLARQTGADTVYWNRLYEPAVRARDRVVEDALQRVGIGVETFNAALLVEPHTMANAQGEPYRMFTPFWRAAGQRIWEQEPEAAPRKLLAAAASSDGLDSLGLLPKIRWDRVMEATWRPGEAGALATLDTFCDEALSGYARQRDFPGERGTSRLSPHLHFGEIAPVQIVARLAALQARGVGGAGAETFLKELGWREFAHYLLWHFPHTAEAPLDARFEKFPWRKPAPGELRAWQRGRTGLPIVDAGLRELWATGWMHNRVRMVVASLLTKNLLLPWQEGARWYWDTLVDADLANNTLGWQWTAGCGADAAPFFRIFNPVLQSKKFDPRGAYLRRWLPELNDLPDEALHQPRPGAIIDLAASRARALEAFSKIKN
ncbi:MAG TPA: deoxyribodipyrimidine photo-lyase [Verrucomicrobiae bacterium]|nr:deoxyribodipyrimidine photo-lyase [Verrucomicrobiae bacterium]